MEAACGSTGVARSAERDALETGFARALIIGGVLVVALIGVHGYNATRFNVGELRASAEPLLARARQINERARSEYQDLALATLAPSPLDGPYYWFDDKLDEAVTIKEPGDDLVAADSAIVHAFDSRTAPVPA